MKKFKVSLGGYTKKYFCSRLSAISYARKISKEKASSSSNWTQTAEVKGKFEILFFKDGKKTSTHAVAVALAKEDFCYY